MAGQAKENARFFSLKWKAGLLFSLILIGVNGGLAALGYLQLQHQFVQHQREINQQQAEELRALVLDRFQQLEQVAALTPVIAASQSGESRLAKRLETVFEQNAATLEIDWGLDFAAFFSSNGELLYHWQSEQTLACFKPQVAQVNRTQQPLHWIDCQRGCRQFVAEPLLDQAEYAGVTLLGRPISDLILAFNSITGADIALLSQSAQPGPDPLAGTLAAHWGVGVVARSQADQLLPMLNAAASRIALTQLQGEPQQLTYAGNRYALQIVPLSASSGVHRPQFLIINDITRSVEQIEHSTRTAVIAGLLGLLLSEAVLLLLLWSPMRRLRLLSRALPLLAQNAFAEVQHKLARPIKRIAADEIDVAGGAVLDLAARLEALNLEVRKRAISLIERSEELARERDFVTSLLHNAQVVILTQGSQGQLLSINPEGERVFGCREEQAGKLSFLELIEVAGEMDDPEPYLQRLKRGEIDVYQHDSWVVSDDGCQFSISWVHSRLPAKDVDDLPLLLSIGLDVTERKVAERNLAWLADHDPLTELFNRRRLVAELERLLERSERYDESGALLFIDLDQFKYVNDISGHQAGDALLKIIARQLAQATRSSDILARIGGDEFAMLLPNADVSAAVDVAGKLLDVMKGIELPSKEGSQRISASIGVVLFPDHGVNLQDLMANADLAMYQAKERGRDRWHLFAQDEQIREQMSDSVSLKGKIEWALAEGGFLLHYQPIMEIASRRISHYEVLLRLREADARIVMPGDFIPVAEKTGLIHSIDRLVLREAINRLAELGKAGQQLINLSVNLSGWAVDDPELLPLLKQLLQLRGVRPQQLVFEITETAALADMTAAESFIRELQELGCRFAMDDFGVGFSSFYYLRELPLDIVKIDGSFIRQLPQNRKDQVFVKALVEMASGLGKKTIAEFVEDEATLHMLEEIGVDYVQGYFIGRPQTEIELPTG
ncbi:bifunctional diguanylate cyclase/phosphodiesterase [endosymbiont of Ridgeia piscesae]|jgi:diguanylate cyclase (GGDEF)-like protein/PAS domain S-box-containing protein|uniref:Diguanylate cyclase/phosphodiesterase n=1 Tax=endosymbiont of Ridgeia piscesae TaxID=54398 RepID=A0A0T5Z7E2_9GAMM|nr:EAL domain-containing protein [endosymbiont of Ridgeia piscesae]KRT56349.1 diguanylate cyclase/phosphodiesterase [endosymbiont of Ridgeia piscesae]KRT58842.1 diguanylate cyclase/phosphodiesterase [endosymbiont of Ridgeia piscesae]